MELFCIMNSVSFLCCTKGKVCSQVDCVLQFSGNITHCAYCSVQCTVGPLYKGHFGTLILVLTTEVSSIWRSFGTLQHYTGTQNGVPIIEVSTFQRFTIERFQCTYFNLLVTIVVCLSYYYSNSPFQSQNPRRK